MIKKKKLICIIPARKGSKGLKNKNIKKLGNIPLIGRLFQSSAESYQKRNLLIFVTASIVSRGGSPVRENIQNITPQSIFKDPVILTPTGTIRRNFKDNDVPVE